MTADVPAAEAMDVDKPEPSGKSSGEGEARTEPAASDGQNLVDALRQLEDDPSSEEDEDLAAGGGKKKVLVGGEGADFVAAELGRNPDVADAIKRIQDQGALKTVGIDRESDAEPLLGLLGQLGMTRAEVYRHTLDDALKELRDRIEAMPQGTLLSLLDASFPYIGIEELKAIPLAALEHLKPVPSSYLKQISRNVELFRQLPVEVQRQCWELRGELLRRHTAPALTAYAEETATTMRNLDQDLALAPLDVNEGFAVYIPGTAPSSTEGGQKGHVPKPHVPGLPRASLRRASASVQRLKRVVGDSKKLYLGVVINCRVHFAEHGDVGACSLRSQLLMSLHDDEKTGLCGVDRCHRLAWLADACVRDRCLDGRRCAEIVQIIEKIDFDSKAGERAARAKTAGSKKKATPPAPSRKMATRSAPPKLPTLKFTFGKKKEEEKKDEEKKEEDAKEPAATAPAEPPAAVPAEPSVGGGNTDVGAPGPTASDADDGVSDAPAGSVVADLSNASGENLLGDAAMCLRDPPVLHLLLHETLRTLDAALEKNKNAKKIEPLSKNARLEELTRLVTLALAARRILRDRAPSFPEVPAELMDRFYPLLGDVIASGGFLGDTIDDEGKAGDAGGTPSDEEGEVPEDMELAEVEETNEDGEIVLVKKWRPRSKPAFRIKINVKSAKKASVKQQIAELSEMMKTSDVARKIALTHALRRLREGDVAGANPILAAAAAGGLPDSRVGDEQPFAVTLARRLAAMNSGMGAVEAAAPGGALWRNAVDGCLLRCCVAGLEVHEETLRLVLAASARMTGEDLCSIVESTLHVTRKSRKVNKRRAKPIVYEYEPIKPVKGVIAGRRGLGGGVGGGGSFGGPGLGGSSGDLGGYASASSVGGLGGYTSGGTDAGSDGAPGNNSGADGVQATYQLLVRRESARLTEAAAPKLHEYLARKDRRDMKRSGRAVGGVGDEDDAGRPFSP